MSEESPLFPLQPQELFSTAKTLFKSAFPISLTYFATMINTSVSIAFAQKSKNHNEVAGVGLGSSLVLLLCVGIFLSLDQGFAILASKLFGTKKYRELGVIYQRNLCLATIISLPMILLLAFPDFIFMFLGWNEEICFNVRVFLRSMIPSIIATYIFSSTKHFLISQNIFKTPAIIIVALIPVHALLCYIFVDILEMHVAGIGFAKSITDIAAAILLLFYIRFTGICKDTWIPWTRECLDHLGSHFRKTLVLGATSYLQLFTYQCSTWMIGALNNVILLMAHISVSNLVGIFFFISLSVTLSMQISMGHAIGEGFQNKVLKILTGGLFLNFIVILLSVMSLLIFRKQIALFFTYQDGSIEILQNMLLLFALACIPESFANIIGGALRVVGKEKQILIVFFFCETGLCVIGQWIFGKKFGYGYIAVWLCTVVAAFVMFIFVVYQVLTMDWKGQIGKVKRALDEQIYAETQGLIEFADMTEERGTLIERV